MRDRLEILAKYDLERVIPRKLHQRLVVNGTLFVSLALIALAIPLTWLSRERFFFYWDLAMYHNMTIAKANSFLQSPFWALYGVFRSIQNNYNEIFTLPLVPFILAFGNSRQVYITSVA